MQAALKHMFARVWVQAYVTGNLTQDEAQDIAELVESSLKARLLLHMG